VTRTLRGRVALSLCLVTMSDCVQHGSLDSAGQGVTALAVVLPCGGDVDVLVHAVSLARTRCDRNRTP